MSIRTGQPTSAATRSVTGTALQPGMFGAVRMRPVETSTTPGLPMPTAQTPVAEASDRRSVRTAVSTVSRTSAAVAAVARRTSARGSPARSASCAWTSCAPTCTPTTQPSSLRKRTRCAGRPGAPSARERRRSTSPSSTRSSTERVTAGRESEVRAASSDTLAAPSARRSAARRAARFMPRSTWGPLATRAVSLIELPPPGVLTRIVSRMIIYESFVTVYGEFW